MNPLNNPSFLEKTINKYSPVGLMYKLGKLSGYTVGLGNVSQWDHELVLGHDMVTEQEESKKKELSVTVPIFGSKNGTRKSFGLYNIVLNTDGTPKSLEFINPEGKEYLGSDYLLTMYKNGKMIRLDDSNVKFPGVLNDDGNSVKYSKLDSETKKFLEDLNTNSSDDLYLITEKVLTDFHLENELKEDVMVNKILDRLD